MGERLEVALPYIADKITAGVDYSVAVGDPAYSSGDWTLTLHLRGATPYDLPFDRDASRHVLSVKGGDTAAWVPGRYAFALRASNVDGSVVELEKGSVTILPDIAAAGAGFDGRSQAQTALDAISAVLAKRATVDQQRYRINNRELYRMDIGELLKLRSFYVAEVARENAATSGRGGFGRQIHYVLRDGR